MSDSNILDPIKFLDDFLKEQKLKNALQPLDDLIAKLTPHEDQLHVKKPANKPKKKPANKPEKKPEPTVRWKKRDKDGNEIFARPRSSRNQSHEKTDHIQKTSRPSNNVQREPVLTPETIDSFLQELESSLNIPAGDLDGPSLPKVPRSSTNWETRQSLFSESWKAERPRLVNTMAAQQGVSAHVCQQCGRAPAALRCPDCLPRPFFCDKCDVVMHTRHVLHNRDAMTAGFFQPLPPTTYVLNETLCHDARFVPVETPVSICDCPSESLRIKPGKAVAVVTLNGRYDLSMPKLGCEGCEATWTCGVHDLHLSYYWPATLHFFTLYATDVFFTFQEMKMVAPDLSCRAFLKMLDQRTVRFGRTGKISADSFRNSFSEWEAARSELDKMSKIRVG